MTELGFKAGRLEPDQIVAAANRAGKKLGVKDVVRFFYRPYLYIDDEKIAAARVDRVKVEQAIADPLTDFEGIALAVATSSLFAQETNPLVGKVRNNHHVSRSGDIYIMQQPYWEQVEFEVPDNWWHNKDYYNVPLDVFMNLVKKGIRDGYTICIGGDVSEAGKSPEHDVFVVPTFDIPSEYIDDNARQFRFSNETTTDDHGVHMVGYLEKEGKDWYLIKDSGSSSRNGNYEGYYFFHEDYVKLKMLGFTIHKDVMGDYINKFSE